MQRMIRKFFLSVRSFYVNSAPDKNFVASTIQDNIAITILS